MKNIAIIGASGSIGTQTIDILKNNRDKYKLIAFGVGRNTSFANEVLELFPEVELVSIENENDIHKIETRDNLQITHGAKGLIDVCTIDKIDMVVTAVVGFIGLKPTIEAIKANKTIALANKETLVTAGHIIMPLVKEKNVDILPVDSEHSAIFQVLQATSLNEVNKLILTASGGSFRDKTREQLNVVTVKDALDHPNWSMGSKITIDSATMFNKGLEIIEAHHLFGIDYDNIEVIIHYESIIHSMIETNDYSVLAQLGTPDMRGPINYALNYPKRGKIEGAKQLNLAEIMNLTFKKPDYKRYPALELAYIAGKTGGSMPTVLNAANEVAVDLFLNNKIKFLEIEQIVKKAMDQHKTIVNPSIDDILNIDMEIRKSVLGGIND